MLGNSQNFEDILCVFFTFSKIFVKQFAKDHFFWKVEKHSEKFRESRRWRSISRNLFFRESVKKSQDFVSLYLQNRFQYFWWLPDAVSVALYFWIFSPEKIQSDESTFNDTIHECYFSCVSEGYKDKISLLSGSLNRFQNATISLLGTIETFENTKFQ